MESQLLIESILGKFFARRDKPHKQGFGLLGSEKAKGQFLRNYPQINSLAFPKNF